MPYPQEWARPSAPPPPPHLQADLLGIDPAPTVPEVRYSIVGKLSRPPEVRVAPDGQHAHLTIEIVQPPHAGHSRLPIAAMLHSTALADMHELAKRLHAAALVLLICRGIDFDAGRHQLRAWRCDRIAPIAAAEAAQFIPDQQLDHQEA